ncbi:MAG TPA: hypothetical protein VH583_09965 [Vicinamibacterales bacterium]
MGFPRFNHDCCRAGPSKFEGGRISYGDDFGYSDFKAINGSTCAARRAGT